MVPRLDPALAERLAAVAEVEGRTVTDVAREAIAAEVLGCDTGTALAQADISAADDALAQAGVAGRAGAPGEARLHPAEAAIAVTDALLRHPPFPAHREKIAVAAGLQGLEAARSQARRGPRAAVAELLAESGRERSA